MNLWMQPANPPSSPYIAVFRCRFSVDEKTKIPFRFSADECCQLFIDGNWLMAGAERGTPQHWYYQNGEISVNKGNHTLIARVLCFGKDMTAYGQMSVQHGFYFAEDSKRLLDWDYQLLEDCEFQQPFSDWGTFPRISVGAAYNPEILSGQKGVWSPVEYFADTRVLHAPDLPRMRREAIRPISQSGSIHSFASYVCVWAVYTFRGKGKVSIRWAECPYKSEKFDPLSLKGEKEKRDGNFWVGNQDQFQVDGVLTWYDYWWRAGRHVEIVSEGSVEVEANFFQTGYPFPRIAMQTELEKMALNTLQCCSYETFMDCPYYEQLMYIGDSRIEALIVYHLFDDHRLPEKALRTFILSQQEDGSLLSQYPSKGRQVIPSFTLIYLLMLHDYFQIHGRNSLIREILPKAEKIGHYILANLRQDGLLSFPGWNFIDWTNDWTNGVPLAGACNCPSQWFAVLALEKLAEMTGKADWQTAALQLKQTVHNTFYDAKRGLYADDHQFQYFSEHAQVLALLANPQAPVCQALRQEHLTECSIYFSFYYLQACRLANLPDLAERRLQRWQQLLGQGLTTLPEEFDNPRSDCHAWSSHILLAKDYREKIK